MLRRIKIKLLTAFNDIINKLIADSFEKTRAEMYEFVVNNNLLAKDFMDYIANAALSDSFATLLSSFDYIIESINNSGVKVEGEVLIYYLIAKFLKFKLQFRAFFVNKLFFNRHIVCPYCKKLLTFKVIYKNKYICTHCGNPLDLEVKNEG